MATVETNKGRTRFNKLPIWVMPSVAILLVLASAMATYRAKSWPLVHDAPLIHYVVFLMDHGWAPYRDIVEMNTPGTYIIERLGVHILGEGAFGWWLYDALSGLVTVCASAWIAGSRKRSAGVAAGALAYLFHLRRGPENMGQRDWIVAVFLLVAFGCLFEGIRKQRPIWMAGFMCFCGLAASIKPPAMAIGVCFLIAACFLVKNNQSRPEVRRYLLWAIAGSMVPLLLSLVFLLDWGVTREFIVMLRGLAPYYAGLQRLSYSELLKRLILLKPLLLGAFAVYLLGKSWRNWESNFLMFAALAGAALFLLQGKGWEYHLYPAVTFATLWAMCELEKALQSDKWQAMLAILALLVTCGVTAPRFLRSAWRAEYPTQTLSHLQSDLENLGGSQLSGKVQCLDMTMGGCINVLYRMKLIQSTGFIYDYYLFPKEAHPTTTALQSKFLRAITSRPPELIVLSSHTWPGDTQGYQQVENWPKFNDVLQKDYSLIRELPKQTGSSGYRIYHHKDTR